MPIPSLNSVNLSLPALFPTLNHPSKNHNFWQFGYRFPFSVLRRQDKIALSERKTVLDHYFALNYYKDEFEKITNGYRLSRITNEAVTQDVFFGDLPDHPVPKDEHYWYAVTSITDALRPPKPIRPVHFADLRLYPWKKSTNAEAPFSSEPKYQNLKRDLFNQRKIPNMKNTFANFQDIIFHDTRHHIHLIKTGNATNLSEGGRTDGFLYWSTTHAKTSVVPQSSHDKIRMVFGCPKTFIFAEAMFFWPLFAHYMSKDTFPILWNYPMLNGGWMRLNQEFYDSYFRSSILMIDWKQFDKRALFTIIEDIEIAWSTYFDFENGYQSTFRHPNSHTDKQKLLNLWDWMCYARKHLPILLPDGRLLARMYRGVMSGLFTTQLLDSFYNAVMILTILDALGIKIDVDTMLKLMGDDSLTRLPLIIPPNQHESFMLRFQELATYYFDSVVSTQKSKIQNRLEQAEVLSYTNNNGYPSRDLDELAARLYHTKDSLPTPGKTMSQCIGIAYATANPHSKLYRTCRDIYTHYALNGYTPSETIPFVFASPLQAEALTSDFPSPTEVISRLMMPSTRSPVIQAKYWPLWHFVRTPECN
jgi:hypothetical protein